MGDESISFLFVTATSGSMEKLIERSKLPEMKWVVKQALEYYMRYLVGTQNNGPKLVCVNFKLNGGQLGEFTDERTADHYEAGMVDVKFDLSLLEDITKWADKSDPSDTLTSTFIVYEQILDALETRLAVGRYERNAEVGNGHFEHLPPKQFIPFYPHASGKLPPTLQMSLQ